MNKLKIGDTVKTEDGIGKVVFIDDNAFKFPNKMGVDVLIDGCSEQYGYSLSDLELITEPAFKVSQASIHYENVDGQKLRLSLYKNGMIGIESDDFYFANQSELDAILADFKRRAQ